MKRRYILILIKLKVKINKIAKITKWILTRISSTSTKWRKCHRHIRIQALKMRIRRDSIEVRQVPILYPMSKARKSRPWWRRRQKESKCWKLWFLSFKNKMNSWLSWRTIVKRRLKILIKIMMKVKNCKEKSMPFQSK